MLGLAPDPIPLALAIGALALAIIGATLFAALVISGHWRRVREADRRAVEREAALQGEIERKRIVIEFYAAESARMRAIKQRQARRQHEAVLRRNMTEILRQDAGAKL